MRHWASIVFVGAGAWACGPTVPASVAPPSPEVSMATAAKAAPPSAPAASPPAPPPPLQVRDVAGVRGFFAELCRRSAAADDAWLRAHVRFPLVGSAPVGDEGGEVMLGGLLLDNPGDVTQLGVCKAPLSDAAGVQIEVAAAPEVTARFDLDGQPRRATFDGSGGEPVLTGFSVVLRERAEPQAPRKVRSYSLDGNVISETERFGGPLEGFVLAELKQRPACVRAYAARSKDSAALRIHARKRDGETARVRVLASTVAPASLLACIERQLDAAVAGTFRGKAFEVEYMLRVAIPLAPGEEDPNAVKAVAP